MSAGNRTDSLGNKEDSKQFDNKFANICNISTCIEPVMIRGCLAERARNMEEKYPDMCWRYQDTQSQLLITSLKCVDESQKSNLLEAPSGISAGFMAAASFVVSPADFHLQPFFLLNKINRLMEDMSNYYNEEMEPVPSDCLYEGMPCAVRFPNDGKWYRAIVVKAGLTDARIQYVDWGNSQLEPVRGIKPLTKAFGRFAPLTFRCRIEGAREETMIQKVIDQFQDEIQELQKIVYCLPKSVDKESFMNVILMDPATKQAIGEKYLATEPLRPNSYENYQQEITKLYSAMEVAKANNNISQSSDAQQIITRPIEVVPSDDCLEAADSDLVEFSVAITNHTYI